MKCQCGCGQDAPVATRTDVRRGRVKGQPLRFVHGHNRRKVRAPIDEKKCSRCLEIKPASAFYIGRGRPDGLRSHCRDCAREGVNASNAARRDEINQRQRESRLQDPERHRAYTREWAKNNRASVNEKQHRRRARIRSGLVEKIDPFAIYERDGGRCHICGKHVPKSKMSLDHLVPVSKGGDHIALNVRLAHLECNLKRGAGRIPAQLLLT